MNRDRKADVDAASLEFHLASPISLRKILSFGLVFLIIQISATAAARWLGNSGVLVVSALGGMVSSASTTAAAAKMASHSKSLSCKQGWPRSSPRLPAPQ